MLAAIHCINVEVTIIIEVKCPMGSRSSLSLTLMPEFQ